MFCLVLVILSLPLQTRADCGDVVEVDINSAPTTQLECLDGIGPTYAERIIDNRPYSSLDELQAVKGIGQATVDGIEDQGKAYLEGGNEEAKDNDDKKETEGSDEKININTAGADVLQQLHGIGQATADDILSYRKENTFYNTEDIKKVSGIAEGIFNDIASDITVGDVDRPDEEEETTDTEEEEKRETREKININTAEADTLKKLVGIGPAYAQTIVANRPFSSLDELQQVDGVGEATVEDIKDQGRAYVEGGEEQKEKEDESRRTERENEGGVSAHASPAGLSGSEYHFGMEISAGRDRVTATESALKFRPVVDSEDDSVSELDLEWAMGDGSVHRRTEVKHRYQAAGSYTVVLTARSSSGEEAVSRLTVEVVEPEVVIKEADRDKITLFNPSGQELDLGEWRLVGEEVWFAIPDNTIIKPESGLSLPSGVTGITVEEGEKIKLTSPQRGYRDSLRGGERSGAISEKEKELESGDGDDKLESPAAQEKIRQAKERLAAVRESLSRKRTVNEGMTRAVSDERSNGSTPPSSELTSAEQDERQEKEVKESGKEIDINTAESNTLQELVGIGEVTAGAIIEYRQRKGGFSQVADITEVPGIGPSTFSDIEPYITVDQDLEYRDGSGADSEERVERKDKEVEEEEGTKDEEQETKIIYERESSDGWWSGIGSVADRLISNTGNFFTELWER